MKHICNIFSFITDLKLHGILENKRSIAMKNTVASQYVASFLLVATVSHKSFILKLDISVQYAN